jgi:hypothetical protein
MSRKYNLSVRTIRADNEFGRKRTISWLQSQGISFEPSAPNTQAQNGLAERSGGAIIEKAYAMRNAANLPHDLWNEIVNSVVYLRPDATCKPCLEVPIREILYVYLRIGRPKQTPAGAPACVRLSGIRNDRRCAIEMEAMYEA